MKELRTLFGNVITGPVSSFNRRIILDGLKEIGGILLMEWQLASAEECNTVLYFELV